VNGYDGRPTESQLNAQQVLTKQLTDARATYDSLAGKEMDALNAGLGSKKLDPVKAMSRQDWEKKQSAG
jgi:hypothetical protein